MTDPAPNGLGRHELVALAISSALVPLNSTMIAVALPDVAEDFGVASGSTGLLVTIYLVVMLVGQPTMGRVIDAVGGRRALKWSLLGFAATSVVTSLVQDFALLIVGRALQAVCGAALMPASQALVRSLSAPDRRGRSFGLLGSVIGGGAAIGPVIGGLLTQVAGWQGIFLVNAPLVAAALLFLRGIPRTVPRTVTDAGGGSGGVFAVLKQRTFVSAFMTQATTTLGQYSLLLVVPITLDARGWSSAEVGLSLTALTVGMVIMGPVGGRVGDAHGRRYPVVLGSAVGLVATVVAALVVDGSAAALIAAMAVFGFGTGFAVPSVQTAALESVPDTMAGSASGVLSMSRYTGSIPASILLAVIVSDAGSGAQTYLALASAGMLAALLIATQLPSRTASGT